MGSVELDSFDPIDFGKMASGMVSLVPGIPKPEDWAPADAMLCIMVNAKENKDAKVEALHAKDKCALIFPGLTIWHTDESKCPKPAGPEDATEVTFTLKNVAVCNENENNIVCRFVGKLEAQGEETNKYSLIEFEEYAFDTFEAMKKHGEAGA